MRDAIGVRKRFSPAERARVVDDYRASGVSQSKFAARVGISVSCLCNWLRQAQSGTFKAEKISFLEIPPSAPRPISCYKVHFPGGVAVEAPRGFAPAELREVLRLAREL